MRLSTGKRNTCPHFNGLVYTMFTSIRMNIQQQTFIIPIETLLATSGMINIKANGVITPWVQEGDMIIFPSWLEHAAPMNKSSKMRSTISFNFFIERRNL